MVAIKGVEMHYKVLFILAGVTITMRPYVYDDKFEIPVYSHFLPKKHGLAPDLDVSRHPLSNHVGLVFFTARNSFILNKNHFFWSLAEIATG